MVQIKKRLGTERKSGTENREDIKKDRFEWEKVFHALSEFYRCDWQTVILWNIYTFHHRLKFMEVQNQQQINNIKRVRRGK